MDDQLLMDVYALEISHTDPNIYFAGLSKGIMKSTDGGVQWNLVNGIINPGLCNTITMHPTNPNIVFAIDRDRGRVYKSTDQGDNFNIVADHNSWMYDLEFHPGNSNIVYASGNDIVYKSTNGGDTFFEVNSGPWSGSGNAIMMAVTPSAASYVYAAEETVGGFNALYLSTNEGVTWSTITSNSCNCRNYFGYNLNSGNGQAPRDMDIIVSPVNPNIIHLAGTETHKSEDLGQNWTQTTFWNTPDASNFIHADIDLLIYDNNRIVAGTDGGIYYSTDEATSWTNITPGIGVRQFYRIGASETDADRVSGGSQDNGTGVIVSDVWYDWLGADGMETFIDWSNENVIYGTIQFGPLYKSTDGGQTRDYSITTPGTGGSNWVTPFEQDPLQPNVLYTGRQEIWKSINAGASWQQISSFAAGAVDELKIAPSDNNYIYAGINNKIYYTSNGGASWNSSNIPSGFVNYISVNPYDPNKLAIAVSGSTNRVYESTNGALSWTNITANIPPDIGIECVLYEQTVNGGLFCGGNPGIYYTPSSASPNWEDSSNNLPKVRVSELDIRNQVMYVATYGRGLWKFDFECDANLVGQGCDDLDVCTVNDVYDANCNCNGTYADSDNDSVCDGLDTCPGGDDTVDLNNNGIPDFCDDCGGGSSFQSGCGITMEISGLNVSLSTSVDPDIIKIIKVRTAMWDFQADLCNNWNPSTECEIGDNVTVHQPGTFIIDIQGAPNCIFEIQVDGISGGGVDNDGDGICTPEDCDDNDPNLPVSQTTSCDDGDPNTNNDIIMVGECLCMGTPTDCNVEIPVNCTAESVCANFETLCASWTGMPQCVGTLTSTPLPEGNYLLRVPDQNGTNGICWIPFSVDDFSDFDSNCEEAITHTSNNVITQSQYAHSRIISNGIVLNGPYVEFVAGTSIELLEGFEVKVGPVFHAYIDFVSCED